VRGGGTLPAVRGALEKYVGLWLVFCSGLLAGVYGLVMILLERHVGPAAAETVGGLCLIAWVIFHPARVPERARIKP
jgi:hypothetical protein